MSQQKSRVCKPSSSSGDWSPPLCRPPLLCCDIYPQRLVVPLFGLEFGVPDESRTSPQFRLHPCSARSLELSPTAHHPPTILQYSVGRFSVAIFILRDWSFPYSGLEFIPMNQESLQLRPAPPLSWLLTVSQSKSRVLRQSSSLGDWSPLVGLGFPSESRTVLPAVSSALPIETIVLIRRLVVPFNPLFDLELTMNQESLSSLVHSIVRLCLVITSVPCRQSIICRLSRQSLQLFNPTSSYVPVHGPVNFVKYLSSETSLPERKALSGVRVILVMWRSAAFYCLHFI